LTIVMAATLLAGIMTLMLGHVSPWVLRGIYEEPPEGGSQPDDMLAGQALTRVGGSGTDLTMKRE
jgi:hypothetical protein